MPADNETLASTITEVSERVSVLVREEIELAKAEVTQKVSRIGRGAAAVAVGAVFGVFALILLLETLAWAVNAILVDGAGDLWIGFAVVTLGLLVLTVGAFLFARRAFKVGAPAPTMAIEEARKIRETISTPTPEDVSR